MVRVILKGIDCHLTSDHSSNQQLLLQCCLINSIVLVVGMNALEKRRRVVRKL